jgi:hypothetical protein
MHGAQTVMAWQIILDAEPTDPLAAKYVLFWG